MHGIGHERLDVYRAAIDYVGWAYRVAMLTKLGERGYTIHEEADEYSVSRNETDTDTDSDPDSDRSRK